MVDRTEEAPGTGAGLGLPWRETQGPSLESVHSKLAAKGKGDDGAICKCGGVAGEVLEGCAQAKRIECAKSISVNSPALWVIRRNVPPPQGLTRGARRAGVLA